MSGKYLIFGATGSIGSNLSKMMAENNEDVQLIGRDEESLKNISSETGCKYTVVDVLDSTKIESLKNEFANEEIKGIAYCVGSIDLKPIKMVKKEDFKLLPNRRNNQKFSRKFKKKQRLCGNFFNSCCQKRVHKSQHHCICKRSFRGIDCIFGRRICPEHKSKLYCT